MIVKLLTEYHLEFLSFKGGCRGSSECTHVKMQHCWISHALAYFVLLDVRTLSSKETWVVELDDEFGGTTQLVSCIIYLTLNAPIATKVVCFSRLLKCLSSPYGKQCGPMQTAPAGAVCSGSTLFASILNLSVMLGNYL